MASRSTRKTVVTSKTTSSSSSSSARRRGGSAVGVDEDGSQVYVEEDEEFDAESVLSPGRTTRKHEKEQLVNLNDRLATYIDRVRNLENENKRLTVHIRTHEETVKTEKGNMRAAFEAELTDARRVLDETAKEKARLQIEADKARAEYDGQKARIAKLEKELAMSERDRLHSASQVQDLQAKLNTAEAQRKHWEDEHNGLHGELERLQRQLSTAQSQLEEETLLRVDLENRIQSMREEIQFNKNLYQQELAEVREKKETEISESLADMENQYESKLRDSLAEMRAQFDSQLRRNRQEIEDMYEKKLESMQEMVERARESSGSARDELLTLRSRCDTLEKERNQYEKDVDGLERKVKDLEARLASIRDEYHGQLRRKEDNIRDLRAEIGRMMVEYQDLMDIKIQLDVEIEAYRRLLEGEEHRLNISSENVSASGGRKRGRASGAAAAATHLSSSQATSESSSTRTPAKRRRLLQERETASTESFNTKGQANGDIEIVDHDVSGNFIRLRNNGKNDESVGGWQLKRTAGDDEVTYKFHSRSKIDAGATLTVWAKSAGKKHSPPEDYVMKDADWPTGERLRTELINGDDEEMAWRESSRSGNTSTYSFRSGLAPADLQGADPDGRCAIM